MHSRFIRQYFPFGVIAIPTRTMWTTKGSGVSRQRIDRFLAEETRNIRVSAEECGHGRGVDAL